MVPVPSVWGMLVGFIIWRFFDIVKLPFIDRSQDLPGGWGVMTDDLLAGICANVSLRGVLWLLVRFAPAVGAALVR
jgi:phosphatidylglycerophosphatase A